MANQEFQDNAREEKRRLLKIDEFAYGYDANYMREIVRSHPLFKDLSTDDINSIIERSEVVEFPEDTVILKKGEFPDCIYLLVDGVLRKEIDAENSLLLFLGSVIGVYVILNPGKPIDVELKTESTCRLLKIGLNLTSRFINKYPAFEKVVGLLYFQHFLQVNKLGTKWHDVG